MTTFKLKVMTFTVLGLAALLAIPLLTPLVAASSVSPSLCTDPAATVAGMVAHDADASGTADLGEGLAGITVTLHGGGPTPLDVTLTDADGCYRLTDLAAEEFLYTVTVDAQAAPLSGLVPAFDPDGTSTPHQFAFNPPPTASDFGYVEAASSVCTDPDATVVGMVAHDTNENGLADLGEGLAGITVTLQGGAPTPLDVTVTDANGCYRLTDLAAEEFLYTVTVDAQAAPLSGLVPAFDPDGTGTPHQFTFNPPPTASDFGYIALTPTAVTMGRFSGSPGSPAHLWVALGIVPLAALGAWLRRRAVSR